MLIPEDEWKPGLQAAAVKFELSVHGILEQVRSLKFAHNPALS